MKHKRWAWISLVVVAIVIAIGVLIASLPRLIEAKLQAELAKFGIFTFTLGEPYWGLTGAGTTALRFAGAHQEWRYSVDLGHVQANYTLQALLDGEVASLGIGSATLVVEGGAQSPPQSSDINLEQMLSDIAAMELPIDAIVVNDLNLRVQTADFTVEVKSPELSVNTPNKTVVGKITILPDLPQLAELPTLHLVAQPGDLSWVPDLAVSIIKDDLQPLEAQLQLRRATNGVWQEGPFYSSFNLKMPEGWIGAVSSYVPHETMRTILAQSDATLSINGQLGLPGVLPLSNPDWYLTLPIMVTGQADIVSSSAEFGLDRGAVTGRFEAVGTGQSLVISSPETVTIAAELVGEKIGFPSRLADGDGRLGIEGEVRLDQPITFTNGQPGEVVLGVAINQSRANESFHQWTASGDFSIKPQGDNVNLVATENLVIEAETTDALRAIVPDAVGWPPNLLRWVQFSTKGTLALQTNLAESSLSLLKTATIQLASGAEKSSQSLHVKGTVLKLSFAPGDTTFAFDSQIQAPFQGKLLPGIHIEGRGTQKGKTWHLSSALDVPEWKLASQAQWAVDDRFTVTGRGDLRAAEMATLLKPLEQYGYLPIDISLLSGRGKMDFRVKYPGDSKPVLNLAVEAEALSGIAQGLAFRGARVSGAFSVDSRYSSSAPVEIAVDQLSSGVAVDDIRAALRLLPSTELAKSRWHIDSFSASVFGGELALKSPGEIQLPELGNSLTFKLSKVQLKNVLSLYEEQGIDGVGILNGEIPVVIEKDGVRIDHGTISAEHPGGKISFVYDDTVALAQTNEQLAMALRLLENFNYEVMSVTTDFSPTGDLTLAVGLVGNNPDEFDGRTVNFNVNFQENLFQLFKVLKLTDDLTKKIEERLENQSLH